ncbi:hypothetical protein GPECTOR_99g820 [Gonium pectorale]|uniref:Uncharacterized protein n=1 Tax=Gonium pectorale TaxID=33097 RepID=A0A150G157_GONPE|nr:hypothetical protein GPECTOR_99g820 [Gonium pectorale]|eukprot:KXZ43185.1 hypothetical protein GPECTOR_99g820 [Gonium pectorale]
MTAPRWVVANFNQSPAATGARVSEVLVYILNLDPAIANPITSISLLMQSQGVSSTVAVLVYTSGSQALSCPALNRFKVNATLVSATSLSLAAFQASTVAGVRVDMTAAAAAKQQLPHIAGIGLQLV